MVRGREPKTASETEPSVLFGNRPETKENQRQMEEPIRANQASTQCSLERSVKVFNYTFTLRKKTSSN